MDFSRACARLALVVVATALTGCASGYAKFYKQTPGATPEAVAAGRLAPPTGEPIVDRAMPPSDSKAMFDAYAKRGFVPIGESSFYSDRNESEDEAVKQGVKVGADLVLILNPRYAGSTTTTMPLTTPTTTTSYTNSQATAYGRGGPVTAYGTGTTTTYGTKTTYIPITTHRTDYAAIYFVRQRWGLGVLWRDLSDEERQELQSNKGVTVRLVVENTPAFYADILPGDIILAVNGEPVLGREGISQKIRSVAKQKVTLSLYRRGQRIEKDVQLN